MDKIEDTYRIDDAIVKLEESGGGAFNRRTFVKGGVALAAVLALGGSMGMYAWFTDSEGKKNKTTIAENLDVEVVEPNFPVNGVDDVQPGQTIVKDPAVKNNSDTLIGWLFTEIRVPIAEVKVEGAEAAERLPLFTFVVNDGWTVLQEFEDGDEKVYRYGWDATVAPGGGQTGKVFDSVTFVNLDGSAQELALTEQLVKVIGYGIQDAEQFEGDVAKAWNAYKLQNGIQDGEGNHGLIADIIINTDFVELNDNYKLNDVTNVTDETLIGSTIATTTCVAPGVVAFQNVELNAQKSYSVFPDNETVVSTDSIQNFTVDDETVAIIQNGGQLKYESLSADKWWLVYSADDDSLRVYRRALKPFGTVGEQFNGLTVTDYWYSSDGINFTTRFNGGAPKIFGYDGSLSPTDVAHQKAKSIIFEDVCLAPANMSRWFNKFAYVTLIDITKLNTSKVTNMHRLFALCGNLNEVRCNHLDTQQVTNMDYMFYSCNKLMTVDLSSMDTSHVTAMECMFQLCSSLTHVFVGSNWVTTGVADAGENMFYGCQSLCGGAGTVWTREHVNKEYARVDGGTSAPGYLTLKS